MNRKEMTFHGNMAQEKTQNLWKCLYIYTLEYSEKSEKLCVFEWMELNVPYIYITLYNLKSVSVPCLLDPHRSSWRLTRQISMHYIFGNQSSWLKVAFYDSLLVLTNVFSYSWVYHQTKFPNLPGTSVGPWLMEYGWKLCGSELCHLSAKCLRMEGDFNMLSLFPHL